MRRTGRRRRSRALSGGPPASGGSPPFPRAISAITPAINRATPVQTLIAVEKKIVTSPVLIDVVYIVITATIATATTATTAKLLHQDRRHLFPRQSDQLLGLVHRDIPCGGEQSGERLALPVSVDCRDIDVVIHVQFPVQGCYRV